MVVLSWVTRTLAFRERAIRDDLVIGACQANLLDGDDLEVRPLAAASSENVAAGVFVPEELNHGRRRARSRVWRFVLGIPAKALLHSTIAQEILAGARDETDSV
jgi:hypothetical protein